MTLPPASTSLKTRSRSADGQCGLTFQTDQAFGTLAARMEERGLIRRVNGPGRAIRPELTTEGKHALESGEETMDAVLRTSFERLSATERASFAEMLARLVDDAPGAGISRPEWIDL